MRGGAFVECRNYDPERRSEWDAFVRASKNGMFLFERDFQDYHRDRFTDNSLMFMRDAEIVALMPATRREQDVVSHGGLTYGGVLSDARMSTSLMLAVFDQMLEHFRKQGVKSLEYKTIPYWHQRYPADEDLYALFRVGATLCRRDAGYILSPGRRPAKHSQRRKSLSKARQQKISIAECSDFEAFWPQLEETLRSRHGARPVHTLPEIQYLKSKFPDRIRLFLAYREKSPIAGTVVFEHPGVAHTQYICATPAGREVCALDLLFDWLIEDVFRDKAWFSFGAATESGGAILNEGLAEWKETFGARAVMLDSYKVRL